MSADPTLQSLSYSGNKNFSFLPFLSGYGQSKWVAGKMKNTRIFFKIFFSPEKMVENCQKLGLLAHISRPGKKFSS
jgi:hypothetical protein